MSFFLSEFVISTASWQAFERLAARLLLERGFRYVAVIGKSGDGGRDVLAIHGSGKRWLLQVKRWASPVGSEVLDQTIMAVSHYEADIPVIVSKSGFTVDLHRHAERLRMERVTNVQLWDRQYLAKQANILPPEPLVIRNRELYSLRDYQETAVQEVVAEWDRNQSGSALVVLATGLGKTFVAGEAVRRIALIKQGLKVLVLAHTNDLVYQLERSFWPFLGPQRSTVVVNGVERPEWGQLVNFDVVVATRDVMASAVSAGVTLPEYHIVIVDECHHLGAETYETVLDTL